MEGTSDVSDAGDNVCFDQDSIVILSDDEDEENNGKNGGLDDESIQILSRRVRPSDSGTGPVVISDITRARGNSEGAQSLISSLTSGSALTETTQSRDRAGSEAVSGISSLTESQGGRSTPASAINSGQESELESDVEVGPGSPRNSDPQMAPFVNELPAPKPTVDDSSNNISYGGISKRPFLINAFSTFFKGSNSSIIDDDLDVDTNLTIGSLVKVKGCNKSNSSLEFTGLRITQTIRVHDGPIWTMKFSPDGSYLASGGQDGRIIIWSVGNAHTDTNENSSSQHKRAASSGSASASQPDLCPHKDKSEFAFRLLHRTPYRIFQGHASDVIDLAWSRSNFLLSASVDKTVRLWHISRDDCLQTFKHADIVTGVAFHPTHDRYFVSSCFDRRVRIWDIIPDGAVKEWCLAPDVVTAVNFTPDGAAVVVGLYFGQVFFYDCDGLKYITQIMCQNRRGTYKDGRKVTGLIFQKVFNNANSSSVAENVVSNSSNTQNEKNRTNKRKGNNSGATNSTDSYGTSTASAAVQLLVTTNDNNIRLIHMTDYSIGCKYKGTVNESMQIKASMSEDGRYIICGSEIGRVLIWNTLGDNASKVHEEKKGVLGMFSFLKGHKSRSERNNRFEYFYCIGKYKNAAAQSKQGKQDEETAATVALFAPSSSVLLSCSMNGLNDHEIPAQKIPSLCSSVIVTANARGNIEVFAKHFW